MGLLECEVWLCVDTGGDYSVGKSAADAKEGYESTVQPLVDCDGFRLIKAVVSVPTPSEQPELTGTAPEEGTAALTVK